MHSNELQQTADPRVINELVCELDPEQAAAIVRGLRENVPKYTGLVGRLGTKFLLKLLQKASDNIGMSLTEVQNKQTQQLLVVAARGLSTMAQQGARTIQQQSNDEDQSSSNQKLSAFWILLFNLIFQF
jgi:hypothetical protein